MLKDRFHALVTAMPEDFEAALLQTDISRFYFLDFDADDAGVLLLLRDKLVYLVDSRYIESARARVKNADVILEEDRFAQLDDLLAKEGIRKVYLENQISVALFEKTKEKLPAYTFDVTGRLSGEIAKLRRVKDSDEIDRIRKAQAITDRCFDYILPKIDSGMREIDLMLEMEHFLRASGAENVAFDTIFVGGENTSLPHGHPGGYRLQKGDFITMDFGAKYRGYCSDMTRTVALGEPGDEKRQVYEMLLKAHKEGLRAVRSGKRANEVDEAARRVLRDAGYAAYFGHGLGHAVGIEIHEEPRFSPKCQERIESGMVMTVEPGCYLPGRFGCRIEDMVLVEEKGCEPLPTSPKELIVL